MVEWRQTGFLVLPSAHDTLSLVHGTPSRHLCLGRPRDHDDVARAGSSYNVRPSVSLSHQT